MSKAKPPSLGAETEAQLDAIFAEPPEGFTDARNALAKRLKSDGDSEGAAAVRKLRRPTRPAWVVNRLALKHPEEFAALREAAGRLRAVGAGDASDLREAAAAERKAVARLVELARRELGDIAGASAALDRVSETLQAVAADQEVEGVAAAGRLEREQRVASIGGLAAALAPAKPKTPGESKPAEVAGPAKGEIERARKAVRGLRSKAKTASQRAGRASDRAERAEHAAAEARDAAAEAAAERDEAEQRLEAAEAELDRLENR